MWVRLSLWATHTQSRSSGCDLLRCGEGAQTDCGWVSHRNHLGLAEGVDYIWVSDARAP